MICDTLNKSVGKIVLYARNDELGSMAVLCQPAGASILSNVRRGGINAIPNLLKKYRMSGKIPDLTEKIPD